MSAGATISKTTDVAGVPFGCHLFFATLPEAATPPLVGAIGSRSSDEPELDAPVGTIGSRECAKQTSVSSMTVYVGCFGA